MAGGGREGRVMQDGTPLLRDYGTPDTLLADPRMGFITRVWHTKKPVSAWRAYRPEIPRGTVALAAGILSHAHRHRHRRGSGLWEEKAVKLGQQFTNPLDNRLSGLTCHRSYSFPHPGSQRSLLPIDPPPPKIRLLPSKYHDSVRCASRHTVKPVNRPTQTKPISPVLESD